MDIAVIKKMVLENINDNVALLTEIIELFDHENKKELTTLIANNSVLVKSVAFNVLIIYSMLAFHEDSTELNNAQDDLHKLVKIEPLAKDLIAIYLQTITIQDINPSIQKIEAQEKNARLVSMLTSF